MVAVTYQVVLSPLYPVARIIAVILRGDNTYLN